MVISQGEYVGVAGHGVWAQAWMENASATGISSRMSSVYCREAQPDDLKLSGFQHGDADQDDQAPFRNVLLRHRPAQAALHEEGFVGLDALQRAAAPFSGEEVCDRADNPRPCA